MGNTLNFFAATKTLEKVHSPINGEISVIKSLGFGTYIQVEGLTQSGGVVYDVWRTTLRQVHKTKDKVQRCLIMGLGGGSAAKLVRKYWPDAVISGVDIDPIIVNLGKKYLELEDEKLEIVIGDAIKVLNSKLKIKNLKFDLLLVDMYVGQEVPKKFETGKFIENIKNSLAQGGIVVFNRLYYGEKRAEAVKFLKKVEKYFPNVATVYPEANVMYIASKN